MSTKTNFKRIALVAVAALGLGVLSSAPSNAVFYGVSGSYATLSTTAGTAGLSATGLPSDSTTAGTFSIVAFAAAATDSLAVTSVMKSKPALASATNPALVFMLADTATSSSASLIAIGSSPAGTIRAARVTAPYGAGDTSTLFSIAPAAGATNAYVGGKWLVFMDSNTASSTRVAGTYVYTIVVTPETGLAQTVDISFTVAAAAADSAVIAPGSSTAFFGASAPTSDTVITAESTASTTAVGVIRVITKNAAGTQKPESITATITGGGLLSFGGISGGSLTVAGTGQTDISVLPNGVAGTATITVATTSATFANKTVIFYSKAAKSLAAAVFNPTLAVGSNATAVAVTAKDSNGVSWGGQAYIVASSAADALVGGSATTPVACSYSTTLATHFCPVTTISTGTAKFKVIDAATVALATATSNEVTVTVSNAAPASVKLAFNKATYTAGEKAYITVTVLDAAGKTLQGQTYANLFATGGIASSYGFASGSDTLTMTSIATDASTSATTPTTAGSKTYTVYMPSAGGTVKVTATGGSSLPLAGQVEVSATATVTDSGAAALAAVSALATTVASLKTLITTLTNLVLKIQKKVKA